MKQKAGRANEIGEQNGVRSENPAFQAIEPYPPPHEEIPGEHVAPFLRYEVGIRHHPDHGFLGIARGIEDVVELGEGGGAVRLQRGCNDDEEVHQGEERYDFRSAHEFFGECGLGEEDQEQPEGLREEGGHVEREFDVFVRENGVRCRCYRGHVHPAHAVPCLQPPFPYN